MKWRIAVECESCSGEAAPFRFIRDWCYYRCTRCGLIQLRAGIDETFVAEQYGDSYFTAGGAGYPNYVAESRLLRAHGRRYARILARFMSPGRLLDVGGAAGFIAQGFSDLGWLTTVLDPNPRMIAIAARSSEEARVGTLEGFHAPAPFDVVAMIQVIPHFFDLHRALGAAAAATAHGRYWLVETWNGESMAARLLKSQWHQFSPPSVRRIFTPESLDCAAARYGFARVALGRPRKWLSGAHAKSLLAHKSSDGVVMRIASGLARFAPDGLRIPYPAEDLFWALYRKADEKLTDRGSSPDA